MTRPFNSDLLCPACQHRGSQVVDSCGTVDASYIRRRRECLKCAHRFTSHEVLIGQEIKTQVELRLRIIEVEGLLSRLREDLS